MFNHLMEHWIPIDVHSFILHSIRCTVPFFREYITADNANPKLLLIRQTFENQVTYSNDFLASQFIMVNVGPCPGCDKLLMKHAQCIDTEMTLSSVYIIWILSASIQLCKSLSSILDGDQGLFSKTTVYQCVH